MKCKRCGCHTILAGSRVTSEKTKIVENWLCENCCSRRLVYIKNPRFIPEPRDDVKKGPPMMPRITAPQLIHRESIREYRPDIFDPHAQSFAVFYPPIRPPAGAVWREYHPRT